MGEDGDKIEGEEGKGWDGREVGRSMEGRVMGNEWERDGEEKWGLMGERG